MDEKARRASIRLNGEQCDILLAQMHAQSGKLILTVEGNGSPEMTLPVNHLATGTYILKVQTSAGWFTYKIVKK